MEAAITAPSISTGLGCASRVTASQRGGDGARKDRCDDGQAREVLESPEPVGESRAGAASGQPEGNTQWKRRRRIGEVVDRVRQQRDAA